MIHLTDTSFISALLFFTVALILITCLRRFTKMLERTGAASLVLTFILAAVRLFLPIYLPFSKVISIPAVWPGVSLFFREHPYIWPVMLTVWILGAVGIIAWDVRSIHLTNEVYRACRPEPDPQVERLAKEMGITCPVVTTYDIDIAYAVGLFRHTIYLPVQDVSDEELSYQLSHEYWHIRSFHNEIKVLYGFLSAVLWPDFLLLLFRWELNDLLELHCDEKVIRQLNTTGRSHYVQMLIDMTREMLGYGGSYTVTSGKMSLMGRRSSAWQRIDILNHRVGEPNPKFAPVIICLFIAAFFVSYSVIFLPGTLPSPEDFEDAPGIVYHDDAGFYAPEENSNWILVQLDGRYALYTNYAFSKYLSPDEIDSKQYHNLPVYYEEVEEP